MSEKEATEEKIQEKLDELILSHPDKTIRLFAKLIFNLRFDLNELKLELIKVIKGDDDDVISYGENGECKNDEFYT